MSTAYSYIRFSSTRQEEGDSLRRQIEAASKYAEQNNLSLDTTLNLRDLGVSAFTGDNVDNGALGKFIEAIDKGIVKSGSYLLVENLDRLSRQDVSIALELFLNITRKGISIVTLSDGMVYSQENISQNWTKLIIAIAYMAGAHEQSATKSLRLSSVWDEKRKNASEKPLTKVCPSWLYAMDDGSFLPIPDQVEAINLIFKLFADGYGKQSIAKELNLRNFKRPGNKTWHSGTVQRILTSRTVLGEFQPHTGRHPNRVPLGDPIIGYYPQVVSDEVWKAAQRPKRVGGGANFDEMKNLFRGIVKCGHCGNAMISIYSGRKVSDISHLQCSGYKRGVCKQKTLWNYANFESLFLKSLKEIDYATLFDNENKGDNIRVQLNNVIAEEQELSTKIGNLAFAIADNPSPALIKLMSELELKHDLKKKEVAKIEQELNQVVKDPKEFKESLDDLIDKLKESGNRVKLNRIMLNIIDKITVFTTGTGIQLDGMSKPDTTKSMTVYFKNGYIRIINEGTLNMKLNMKKPEKAPVSS